MSNNNDADSIDGLDLALALGHGSAEARALIEKQSRLIDAQETLARADLKHRGWQIIGERVGSVIDHSRLPEARSHIASAAGE